MPYRWTDTPDETTLTLWPHRSLPRRGFVAVILLAFIFGTIPLYGVLGTAVWWGLLPFVLAMVAGLWWGLEKSYRDGDIEEVLRLDNPDAVLVHRPAKGKSLKWRCNIYWVRAEIHPTQGPVPNYLTLSGNGKHVELGRFLAEDERKALYAELQYRLSMAKENPAE